MTCPAGANVLAGGAGPWRACPRGVAIIASALSGTNAWAGTAEAFAAIEPPWRLVVTVVCATGGGEPAGRSSLVRGGRDVLVEAEEVAGVVPALGLRESPTWLRVAA